MRAAARQVRRAAPQVMPCMSVLHSRRYSNTDTGTAAPLSRCDRHARGRRHASLRQLGDFHGLRQPHYSHYTLHLYWQARSPRAVSSPAIRRAILRRLGTARYQNDHRTSRISLARRSHPHGYCHTRPDSTVAPAATGWIVSAFPYVTGRADYLGTQNMPVDVTLPITYTWHVTDMEPIVHPRSTAKGDWVELAWDIPGARRSLLRRAT